MVLAFPFFLHLLTSSWPKGLLSVQEFPLVPPLHQLPFLQPAVVSIRQMARVPGLAPCHHLHLERRCCSDTWDIFSRLHLASGGQGCMPRYSMGEHGQTCRYVTIGPSATLMPQSGMLHLPPQQATAQHTSASTVVVKASIHNLKHEKLDLVKKDFIHLMDSCRHEEAGKHLQPLPPPRFGDVTTSRVSQLHLWLKGYCLSRNVPLTANFTTLFGRL